MKKLLLYTIAMLALTFGSCQQDSELVPSTGKNSFNLKVEIDNIGTGMRAETRAMIVEPIDGEEKVAGLHLLFFEYSTDGSGKFKQCVKVNNGSEITTGTNFAVNFEGANSGNYSILALANADSYFIDSPSGSLQNFLDGLSSAKTESEVINSTMFYTGTSITKDKLLMSGYTQKNDGEQVVILKLTRGVVRFDVQNLDSEYNLVSVSIYNKAQYSPLWLSPTNASVKPPVAAGKFYGVTVSGAQEVKGGLYALENYVANPSTGDEITTSLVVGLEKGGVTQYYRVNINPEESGQSLKRNYVYQLSVRNVLGDGASSEDDANSATADPNLDYDINNWNLDDEGMILTDGKNTLAIPSKIIRFAQEGGKRTYSIFTDGEGTLAMNQSLPNGFSASLSGNTLTVTADDLGALKKREGKIEISFAGLRGEVQIIQEPKIAHFLRLDKSTLNGFPATRTSAYDQSIAINSSKDWNAKIFNTGGSHFSFSESSETLTTTGVTGSELKIYVSQDNSSNKVLNGFVLVSLQDEPGYSRVVMLKQEASSGISIDLGSISALEFTANGIPMNIAGGVSGGAYEFHVDPGTNMGGNFNDWNAELLGSNADKFDLIVEKNGDNQRVYVKAKGVGNPSQYPHFNLTPDKIEDVEFVVYWGNDLAAVDGDPNKCRRVAVSQEGLVFEVSGTTISKAGEEKEITVDIPTGFTWKAEIKSNGHTTAAKYANMEQKGYILNEGSRLTDAGVSITGQAPTSKLKVGFDKLLFPLVNIEPKLEIVVSLEQGNNLTSTIEIKQEKLLPRNVSIGDVTGTPTYGRLKEDHFSTQFRNFAFSGSLFGPTSSSKCYISSTVTEGSIITLSPGSLSSINSYNYVHAGTGKNRSGWVTSTYTTIHNWRYNDDIDGIAVYVQDCATNVDSNDFFANAPFNGKYQEVTSGKSDSRRADTNGSNVVRYLFEDGPFGAVTPSRLSNIGYIDGYHSCITRSSVEAAGGIVVLTESNTNNVLMAFNPKERFIYLGESQLLDDGFDVNAVNSTTDNDLRSHSRFLANYWSYVYRAAQYGSHFTDHFVRTNEGGSWKEATTYPFDKLRTTNPEPMF